MSRDFSTYRILDAVANGTSMDCDDGDGDQDDNDDDDDGKVAKMTTMKMTMMSNYNQLMTRMTTTMMIVMMKMTII